MDPTGVTGLLVAIVVASIAYVLWMHRRPASMPPGPPHIPFLGSIFSMTGDILPKLLLKWKDVYGPVFTFSFGNSHTVVLGDYATIKEGLVTLGTQIAGRPDVHGPFSAKLQAYSPIYPTMGIGDSTLSEEWKKQRNVALQILRGLGYGKHAMEDKIREEALVLRDTIHKCDGQRTDPEEFLGISVANVICSLLYGNRYDHDDAEFKQLIKMIGPLFETFEIETEADFIPILKLRPAYHRNLAAFKGYCKQLNDFNLMKVKEKKARLEKEGYDDPRDFIECYLKELKSLDKSKLGEDWLAAIINDFFLAGAETTATTLQWGLMWMALYPDVQKKVQAEMDKEFGAAPRAFHLTDREKLPYTEATIMEIQRVRPIAPMSLYHTTTQAVSLRGFNLPPGTNVICSLYAALSDPEVWPEPDKLNPDRFLGEDGKVTRIEQWIPFSMGRRMCLGEQLAKQELFLFFSTLLHSFTISLPEGSPACNLDGRFGGVWKPPQYEVVFKPRLI